MGWKIIEIENADSLNLFLSNIIIRQDNNKITIPISDIDVLLINNYKLKITINLINELTNNNVLVIFCDNKYLPQSLLIPIIGNVSTIKIVENQINWSTEYKYSVSFQIIKSKILNQSFIIKYFKLDNQTYDDILSLVNRMTNSDILTLEGHAAKIYWHGLFGVKWKRFDDDYYNKLLNYGYMVLRAYFVRSIVKKGLDPRISLFHKSIHNYFNLASDLMEVFRIIIDYEVYKIYQLGEIDFYNHRTKIIESFNNKIFINGKKHFINNAIDIFVDAIVNQDELLPEIQLDYD